MTPHRLAAALILTIFLLASPVAALGAKTPPASLTHNPPSWLSHPRSPAPATTTGTSPAAGTTQAGRASLPRTGFDLLPEVLLGVLLMAAGLLLRLRRA